MQTLQSHSKNPRYQNGLVLAGGGAKGAYQIGVLKALLDNDIKIGAISGSSIGALNATLMLAGDWRKANDFWLGLSTLRMVRISPLFLFSFILNVIHAVLGYILHGARSEPPTPAILDRSTRLVTPLLVVATIIIMTFALGPLNGDWIVTSIVIFGLAGPLYGILADLLNLSIVSQRPLEQILDAIDWTRVTTSETPIHVTIARWAYSYRHPGIARLATVPENPKEAERYDPGFVKFIERTRWLAKFRRELVPFYPLLNDKTAQQAKALVLASMAFPAGVFRRVKIGKFRYMDGGACDNTPIYPLLAYDCVNLFVTHLRPVPSERGFRLLHGRSLIVWLQEICLLMGRIGDQTYPEFLHRPLPRIIHIAPRTVLGFSVFSTFFFSKGKSQRLIQQGYTDTIKILTEEGFIPNAT
jgi:hypothetical protein